MFHMSLASPHAIKSPQCHEKQIHDELILLFGGAALTSVNSELSNFKEI